MKQFANTILDLNILTEQLKLLKKVIRSRPNATLKTPHISWIRPASP